MQKIFLFILAGLVLTAGLASCQGGDYERVKGDPMQTRIYTLDNGLKVYLTVNPDEPRIQTYIAVRTGSRNDPAESTGLAHYLEHLMFKGTSSFGTSDWEKERPLLDSIEAQYEIYGHTTDEAERRAIYHRIDSFSYEASRYAIANEYDKLMAGIGSNGTNAFTSEYVTCYVENIPSNAVEQWARVQADRFRDLVIRGFHTELEAVYEEYNMYLTDDRDKVSQAVSGILFPHHPYGTQTTIGTQEHLKNPSLVNVRNYYRSYYVPNNIAICMSGDLDPEATMDVIRRYFGDWEKSDSLSFPTFPKEEPLKEPVVREILGRESEQVVLAWPFAGANDPSADLLDMMSKVLCNNMAGLIDLDLNKAQKVLASGAYARQNVDYSSLWVIGLPKEGQTMEEVRDLLLQEIEKLKQGQWDEQLLTAIVNNEKREQLESMQDNDGRAMMFVESFVYGREWQDAVGRIDRLSAITKEQVVEFARQHLTDGYACVYKRQGIDPDEKKIDKPQISPIETNRDKTSQFVTDVLAMPSGDIQPSFLDFRKDVNVSRLPNGNEVLYSQDATSDLFYLSYRIDRGTKADKVLGMAPDYLEYMGTDSLTAEAYKMALYSIACDVDLRAGEDEMVVTMRGLSEHMAEAMQLCEAWLGGNCQDQDVYDAIVGDILKLRADAKLDQRACARALFNYGTYGPDNATTHILSAQELQTLTPADILAHVRQLSGVRQHIVYHGPLSCQELTELVGRIHATPDQVEEPAADRYFQRQPVTESEVIIAPYQAKNIYMRGLSNRGDRYDKALVPAVRLFNEYFGGGMNTVVFQELREARGLAYSASALYQCPSYADDTDIFWTSIITQNDKMTECLNVFADITENMPQSEQAFSLAKDAVLKRLATERILREDVLIYYMSMRDLGIDHDINSDVYEQVQQMELKDLAAFQQKQVKDRTYRYMILGDESDLDQQKLRQLGPIRRVSLQDIFGY